MNTSFTGNLVPVDYWYFDNKPIPYKLTGLRKYVDGQNVPHSYDDAVGYFVDKQDRVYVFTDFYVDDTSLVITEYYEIGVYKNYGV